MQTKTITLNERTVHYIEAGDVNARPVCLLHGNVGDAAFHWQRIISDVATEYHVFAPDLPGYGKSDPLPEPSFAAWVGWLEQFCAALAVREIALIGASFGALIARLYAAAHPQAVPALVLINGGSLPADPGGFTRLLARTPLVGDFIFGRVSRQMVASRDAMQWLVQHPKPAAEGEDAPPTMPDPITDPMLATARESAPALARLMRTQILSTVPEKRIPYLPTLILWGEQDEISPLRVGERLQKVIPGAELTTISNTRHAPHIEEPEIVAFQIKTFLDHPGKSSTRDLPGAGMLG